MADLTLTPSTFLDAPVKIGANTIRERADLALVSIATPLGGAAALANAVKQGWGLAMPTPTASSVNGDTRAIQLTADQLLLIFTQSTPNAEQVVQAKLGGAGYTTEQTDAWVCLQVTGPETRAALERVCPIDLDPLAFPEGAAARSVMEHMGAVVIRTGADAFLLLSASSTAGSFLHALERSYAYAIG